MQEIYGKEGSDQIHGEVNTETGELVVSNDAPRRAPSIRAESWSVPTPKDFEQMLFAAEHLSKTDSVPKHYRNNPWGMIAAWQFGAELGLGMMSSIQGISTINGQPTVWGDTMYALVKGSGLMERMHEKFERDKEGGIISVTCRVKRRGDPDVVERTFALADAQAAGLLNKEGPWKTHRGRMLQWKARNWAFRDKFPDVLKGVAMREDLIGLEIEGELVDKPLADDFKEGSKTERLAQRAKK